MTETRAFYATTIPWDDAGTQVMDAKTSDEVIEQAGMDWEVATSNLILADTGDMLMNDKAIYRTDNNRVLGISRGYYEPFQNAEVFSWMDSLVEGKQAKYVSAGEFQDGRAVWVAMQMGDVAKVADEEYQQYLIAVTGHDLNHAFRVYSSTMRMFCSNQIPKLAKSGDQQVRILHSRKMGERLETARSYVSGVVKEQERIHKWLNDAAQTSFGKRRVKTAEESLFGSLDEATPKRRREAIEQFRAIYEQENALFGDTAYAFVNAVTGYADHAKSYNGKDEELKAERRMRSILDGSASQLKRAGFNAVSKSTKLPVLFN